MNLREFVAALLPPLHVDGLAELRDKCGPHWRRVILTVHGTPIPGWARRAASLECCGVVVHPTDFVPDDPYQILALNDQENPC